MLSKSQARTFFLGGTILFSAMFLGLTFDTHRKVPGQTHAENITDEVKAGKRIWEANNCMGCHTLFGEGAYYAPELTRTVKDRGEAWLKGFLKDPALFFPGQRKMVKYDFTEQEIDQVIAFLEWCGQVDLNGFPAEPPLKKIMQPVVPAMSSAARNIELPAIFEQKTCLGCHQVLGKGQPGIMLPNAVTGEIVPAPVLDTVHQRKTREELIEWISNPQKVKPGSPMPALVPAVVAPEEVEQIVEFLISLKDVLPASDMPPSPAPAAPQPGNN